MKRQPSDAAGAFIREHLSGEVESRAHVQARTRFIEAALEVGKRSSSAPARRAVLLAAAVTAITVAIGSVHLLHTPMTFAVGASRVPGTNSEYIQSSVSEELPLYFSDGSVVMLAPTARARVEKTTSNGAVVLVESGQVSANVVHRSDSDWRFLAGPYSVHVTGTAFALTWRPAGVLDIEMKSGVVVVRGPGANSGVEVRDHHRFVVPNASDRGGPSAMDLGPEQPADVAAPAAVPSDSRTVPTGSASAGANGTIVQDPRMRVLTKESASPVTGNSSATSENGVEAPASWATFVARGEYSRVLGLAYGRGLDATLASAGVEDLSALADAARFSGERGVAERALREVRSRFPGTGRAKSSAFLLGRIADDAGDAKVAVSWYERYLSEAPGGSLAADALGRRMLALRRMNDSEGVRRAALEYLERFPTGPHANIARDIADR